MVKYTSSTLHRSFREHNLSVFLLRHWKLGHIFLTYLNGCMLDFRAAPLANVVCCPWQQTGGATSTGFHRLVCTFGLSNSSGSGWTRERVSSSVGGGEWYSSSSDVLQHLIKMGFNFGGSTWSNLTKSPLKTLDTQQIFSEDRNISL